MIATIESTIRDLFHANRLRRVRKNARPKILYFIVRYPTFSETYMHEEIRSLRKDYDVKIITYNDCDDARRESFPYEVVKYNDWCLVYGAIENIDTTFSRQPQRKFLRRVDAIIREFEPDILHAHYFGLSLLLEKLSNRHKIPFTVRTHSMDVLSEPENKLRRISEAANSSWCKRIIAFPECRQRLLDSGLSAEKVVSCWPVINFERFYKPEPKSPTRKILCAGPTITKKAHSEFIDLAARMKDKDLVFDLYGKGPHLEATEKYNNEMGNPVTIKFADPDDMPEVYPNYDWLVYTADTKINKVGLPVAIAEAQASGLGLCWQELPGRRQEQLDFLGGGGYLYKTLNEVEELLSSPYPEEMRQAGFAAAKRCDIEQHKHLLTDVWSGSLRYA